MSHSPPEPQQGTPRAWGSLDTVAMLAITLAGGILRVVRLGDPRALIFDEVYYAKDACWYVTASKALCKVSEEQTQVHPPLGKWLIAGGIELFGYNALGWRIAAALGGTICISLTYVLARKLLGSSAGAMVGGALLAIDPLHFVQSRVAMIDIFVTVFGLAAFVCLVFDRDRILRPRGRRPWLPWSRPWRSAAGVMAGAATASKWSGIFVVVAVLSTSVMWEIAARREGGRPHRLRDVWRAEGASLLAWLMIAPVAVYSITYLGRLEGELVTFPWQDGAWLRALWDRQFYMLDFHRGLSATHPYSSPPYSWPLLKRPVSYFFETTQNGDYKEVMATGSPLAWWTSLVALAYVAVRWVRRRSYRGPEGLVLAGFSCLYAPWFLLAGDRSAVFLFYLLPALPFMCIALGYAAAALPHRTGARTARVVFVLACTGLFVFYYPVIANVAIPKPQWDQRIFIFDRCDKPPGRPTTETTTETTSGRTKVRTSTGRSTDDLPPEGWCWI